MDMFTICLLVVLGAGLLALLVLLLFPRKSQDQGGGYFQTSGLPINVNPIFQLIVGNHGQSEIRCPDLTSVQPPAPLPPPKASSGGEFKKKVAEILPHTPRRLQKVDPNVYHMRKHEWRDLE